MRQPTEIHEGAAGLFIVVPEGVYKYNEADDCFKRVKFCDENDVDITSRIGTIRDDPKSQ